MLDPSMEHTPDIGFAETHSRVILTFYKSPKDAERTLSIELKDANTLVCDGKEISLFAPVTIENIDDSRYKIEVVLQKKTPGKWSSIDGKKPEVKFNEGIYVDEEGKSDTQSQDVMELFKSIYAKGDENVKMAMEKSFTESQGTVLSTDWSEVGSKQVSPHREQTDD